MTTCTHPSFIQMPATVSGCYAARCTECDAVAYGSVVCTPEQIEAGRKALYADSDACFECKQPVIEGGFLHPYCAIQGDYAEAFQAE